MTCKYLCECPFEVCCQHEIPVLHMLVKVSHVVSVKERDRGGDSVQSLLSG